MGTLGFVLGTAAMDHQQVLIDQLVDQVKNTPADDTFYYLVPNHIKFETEIIEMAVLSGKSKLVHWTSKFEFSRHASF